MKRTNANPSKSHVPIKNLLFSLNFSPWLPSCHSRIPSLTPFVLVILPPLNGIFYLSATKEKTISHAQILKLPMILRFGPIAAVLSTPCFHLFFSVNQHHTIFSLIESLTKSCTEIVYRWVDIGSQGPPPPSPSYISICVLRWKEQGRAQIKNEIEVLSQQ